MKKYRIKDIAALSGVSTGTVDRIIHKRGKVSDDARRKVEKVLEEIDYHPNLIARSLATRKKYRLAVLVPSFVPGAYWEGVIKGINKAEKEFFVYNVEIEHYYFDQYDIKSFKEQLAELRKDDDIQGYILATLFQQETLQFTQELDEKELPYILIDAYIDDTNLLAYYGTNSYDSGYIAGKLIYERLPADGEIALFFYQKPNTQKSTQVVSRLTGFKDYFAAHKANPTLQSVTIYSDDDEKAEDVLKTFFQTHPNVKAGIIFNSRVYEIASFLKRNPVDDFFLVGYDAIEANVSLLTEGVVSHIITQRPEVQGFYSVKALFRYLVLDERGNKFNYMPIDILIKENVAYYNNFI